MPRCPALPKEGGLSPADVARFEEDGFLLIRAGYSPAEVSAAVAELQGLCLSPAPAVTAVYYEGKIRQALRQPTAQVERKKESQLEELALGDRAMQLPDMPAAQRAQHVRKFMGFVRPENPALEATATKPELLAAMQKLCGGKVCLFQDMSMIKPPGGREKPWHQDSAYFNLEPTVPVVGVWIALSNVTTENGAMQFIPGMHKHGPQPHFKRRDWQMCDRDIMKQTHAVTVAEMQPGDVLLFHSLLPHGTPTNTSRRKEQRFALQYHFRPTDSQPLYVCVLSAVLAQR